MKIAILTSPNQWFIPYAKKLNQLIKNSELFLNHKEILNFDIVFILSYHQIIEGKNEITFSLFEADDETDNGDIYLKKSKIKWLRIIRRAKRKTSHIYP